MGVSNAARTHARGRRTLHATAYGRERALLIRVDRSVPSVEGVRCVSRPEVVSYAPDGTTTAPRLLARPRDPCQGGHTILSTDAAVHRPYPLGTTSMRP